MSNSLQRLQVLLRSLSPLAVAFSGGVDSSLLLKTAHDTLGDNCCAVTIEAPYHVRHELQTAAAFCASHRIHHLRIPFDPASVPDLLHNPPDRCYLCKKALLQRCRAVLPPGQWTLADGSTADDQNAHRPGRKALAELAVRSPLAEAGFSKTMVRELSRELGLATWNQPAQSCLLTRFPHLHQITAAELQRVEQAESAIRQLGFAVVRVRSLGDTARIELEEQRRGTVLLPTLVNACTTAGFTAVELDPDGYRCGSMDSTA